MARLLRLIVTIILGAAVGFGTAWLAAGGQPLFGAVRSGPWAAWPTTGTAEIDPYARAAFARSGRIPSAAAAALSFVAETDSTGAALSSRCDYALTSPAVEAQYWTLAVLDTGGFVKAAADRRAALASSEVVRNASGIAAIVLAHAARPGNWLPLPDDGRFSLMLTFYDTPLTTALITGAEAPALPSITKRACR